MGNRTIYRPQHKPHAGRPNWRKYALFSIPAVGIGAGTASFAIRSHERQDAWKECAKLEKELGELGKKSPQTRAGHLANENLDRFLQEAVAELRVEKEQELSAAKSRLAAVNSGLDSHDYIQDGLFTSVIFSCALGLSFLWQKMQGRAGKNSQPESKTAPEKAAPQTETIPGEQPQFPRPPYYEEYFLRLKKAIKREMGPLGSEEAAEVLLRVLPREEMEEIIRDRSHLPYAVRNHWGKIGTVLMEEKGIEPERLFSRLEFDTLDIF